MKKTTKAALAAGSAAVLLLGGATTLAYWTDTETADGGTLNSGHLDLTTDATNTGCATGWTLDTGEDAPTTYADGDPLVPGDVLTKACAFTIDAAGNHLRATVEATAPTMTGTLAGALDVDTTGITINGAAETSFTEENDGQTLSVTLTVTFTDPGTEDNTYNDPAGLSTTLNAIQITATQDHS